MKTAISLDDDLLKAADDAARRLGLSRSRLFAIAVSDFLKRELNEKMLQELNAVYSDGAKSVDKPLLRRMKTKFCRLTH